MSRPMPPSGPWATLLRVAWLAILLGLLLQLAMHSLRSSPCTGWQPPSRSTLDSKSSEGSTAPVVVGLASPGAVGPSAAPDLPRPGYAHNRASTAGGDPSTPERSWPISYEYN
jgi:hypothetical protein